MNVNVVFNIVWLIECVLIFGLFISFLRRANRTKKYIWTISIHISIIVIIFLFIGHLISVLALQTYHYRTIQVFRKYQTSIPVLDRVNGKWILEQPDFIITESERKILSENYEKSSPCFFDRGYCYFELGGFLHNSGGYYLDLNNRTEHDLLSFGFHRISRTVRLVGNWTYYE